jgi:hypothetical protein
MRRRPLRPRGGRRWEGDPHDRQRPGEHRVGTVQTTPDRSARHCFVLPLNSSTSSPRSATASPSTSPLDTAKPPAAERDHTPGDERTPRLRHVSIRQALRQPGPVRQRGPTGPLFGLHRCWGAGDRLAMNHDHGGVIVEGALAERDDVLPDMVDEAAGSVRVRPGRQAVGERIETAGRSRASETPSVYSTNTSPGPKGEVSTAAFETCGRHTPRGAAYCKGATAVTCAWGERVPAIVIARTSASGMTTRTRYCSQPQRMRRARHSGPQPCRRPTRYGQPATVCPGCSSTGGRAPRCCVPGQAPARSDHTNHRLFGLVDGLFGGLISLLSGRTQSEA